MIIHIPLNSTIHGIAIIQPFFYATNSQFKENKNDMLTWHLVSKPWNKLIYLIRVTLMFIDTDIKLVETGFQLAQADYPRPNSLKQIMSSFPCDRLFFCGWEYRYFYSFPVMSRNETVWFIDELCLLSHWFAMAYCMWKFSTWLGRGGLSLYLRARPQYTHIWW